MRNRQTEAMVQAFVERFMRDNTAHFDAFYKGLAQELAPHINWAIGEHLASILTPDPRTLRILQLEGLLREIGIVLEIECRPATVDHNRHIATVTLTNIIDNINAALLCRVDVASELPVAVPEDLAQVVGKAGA